MTTCMKPWAIWASPQDTTVIVYSTSTIFAARLWWILTYAGVMMCVFSTADTSSGQQPVGRRDNN